MAKRFNVEVNSVETGEAVPKNYILESQVLSLVRSMKEDDELVIQRTRDSSPNEI